MRKLVEATPYWVKVGTLLVGLVAATTSAAKFVYDVRTDQKMTDSNEQAFDETISKAYDMIADLQHDVDSIKLAR